MIFFRYANYPVEGLVVSAARFLYQLKLYEHPSHMAGGYLARRTGN